MADGGVGLARWVGQGSSIIAAAASRGRALIGVTTSTVHVGTFKVIRLKG